MITYCGGGVYGAFALFVLHVMGHENAALYDASWTGVGCRPAAAGRDRTGNRDERIEPTKEHMMARVKLVDAEQAEGRTHEVFERVKSYYKMVPGLQPALNYLPETTDALWTLSLNTAIEGNIREELKRVFFAVTAYEVECEYCTAAHDRAHGQELEPRGMR